jgi:hypothetical protein
VKLPAGSTPDQPAYEYFDMSSAGLDVYLLRNSSNQAADEEVDTGTIILDTKFTDPSTYLTIEELRQHRVMIHSYVP